MTQKIKFSGKLCFVGAARRKNFRSLVRTIMVDHKVDLLGLHYVFLSDQALLEMNIKYLKHNSFTDIISFDLSSSNNLIDGEIYISTERVMENCIVLSTPYNEELLRVMAHGLFHLLGYKDKTQKQIREMREKEEAFLSLWRNINASTVENYTK